MKSEVNPRIAVAAIVIVIVVLGLGAWRMFGGGGGRISAKEAGLGRPMKPGEIPGKAGAAPQTGMTTPTNR